ncbi:hypothetical protein DFR70_101330 [Nocardia tenerifensis]|uniref:Uncharacterized protein n=1 Tax=Nocardia tenerifensis TaxID=228006 RepID=A0A318KDQ9_9NOCA|nr:hypothetical protein DFR70_101330 [Nocardia tenerifensis]
MTGNVKTLTAVDLIFAIAAGDADIEDGLAT